MIEKCLKCGMNDFRYGEFKIHTHEEIKMRHELQQMFCEFCNTEHWDSRAWLI